MAHFYAFFFDACSRCCGACGSTRTVPGNTGRQPFYLFSFPFRFVRSSPASREHERRFRRQSQLHMLHRPGCRRSLTFCMRSMIPSPMTPKTNPRAKSMYNWQVEVRLPKQAGAVSDIPNGRQCLASGTRAGGLLARCTARTRKYERLQPCSRAVLRSASSRSRLLALALALSLHQPNDSGHRSPLQVKFGPSAAPASSLPLAASPCAPHLIGSGITPF